MSAVPRSERLRINPARRVGHVVKAHPKWSGLALAVLLAGAGAGSYFAVDGDSTPTAAAQTSTTTTQTVSTGTIRQSVSASGSLAPANVEDLSFSSSGVVTSVLVTEGDTVKKGQKLATIDTATLAAAVAQDNATVANDEAKVDDDDDNDASDAQVAMDKAALVAAKSQLASDQKALAGATMTSPISGVVASVGLTVGDAVSGGSGSGGSGSGASGSSGSGSGSAGTSTSSSSDIEVISTDSWVVNATVDATSVGLIKAGEQAQLDITGATGTVYGTISSVAVLSSSTSGTASYPVVIAVTGSPSGLHDGASVTATLIYKQLSNVIVIPSAALHRASDGTEYVEKVSNGKTIQQTVAVGIASGAQTQITSGLASGDKIVIQQTRPTGVGTGTGTGGATRTGGTGNNGGFGGFPPGGSFGGGTGGFSGFGGAPGGGANGG